MKRKNVTPTPKRRLSCGTLLLVAVCGVIYLAIPRTPRARVAVTPTTAPIRQAVTPTITDTPIAAVPTETGYAVSSSNLRSCASLTCDQIIRVNSSTLLNIIGSEQGETYNGSDIWHIVDYRGLRLYIHSSLVAINPPGTAAAPVRVNTSVPAQIAPPAVARPGNCKTAVAAGLSAEQAAQWSHLDRDDDGVACYGE